MPAACGGPLQRRSFEVAGIARSLYIADLDGTLLRSDGCLSPFTQTVVRRLVADGLRFTFATSRSPFKALSLLAGLDLRLPGICLNGAVVVDPISGRWLAHASIDPRIVRGLIEAGASAGVLPLLVGRHGGGERLRYCADGSAFQRSFIAERAGEPRLDAMPRLDPLDETSALALVASRRRLERLLRDLEPSFADVVAFRLLRNIGREDGAMLELTAAGVDKASRIESLCLAQGIAPADVVVFGDDRNDLPMFRFAGTSVAVANAVPALKREATRHCASNDEDGVARYLCTACGLNPAEICRAAAGCALCAAP